MYDGSTEQIFEAFELFEAIGQNSGTTTKRYLLGKGSKNSVFTELLKRTYDSSMVYYIKKLPDISGCSSLSAEINYCGFMDLLNILAHRGITGQAALTCIESTFSSMSEKEILWYSRVLQKDLNIGIQETMINQEIPGLIPVFKVQLAKEFDGRLPELILAQPKLDGYRCLAHTTSGYLFSRNGKRIEGYTTLEEQVRKLPDGLQLDCEIMSEDFKGTQSNAFSHTIGKKGVLLAFDMLCDSQDDSPVGQLARSEDLGELLNEHQALDHIVRVPGILLKRDQTEELYHYYDSCITAGYEGIMIKDASAPYERKRTSNWQKLKPVKSLDLKVTGVEEGNLDTKYLNMVGRLVCDFEGYEVRVGSGLSDLQRQLWWDNPTLIVGKTVEILYQEISTNQLGGRSLRFPRLKCIRTDK